MFFLSTCIKNNYKCVLKVSEYSVGALDLLAAKFAGAKVRSFRSTNAGTVESSMKLIIHRLLIPLVNGVSTTLIAPSTEAAEFTFGNRAVKEKKVKYLNNGLPLSKYEINKSIEEKLRRELS